jgi:glutamate-ammonia-ligase adenylyltransferase
MLIALHDEGWISTAARDELSEAYRFLRTLEHRIQMVATSRRSACRVRAIRSSASPIRGLSTLKAFEKEVCRHAHIVQRHYALLFEEGPDLASDVGNLVFTGTSDDPTPSRP